MFWQEFLLLVVVALWAGVVWRVVILARERGRNPWKWGIAAFVLPGTPSKVYRVVQVRRDV